MSFVSRADSVVNTLDLASYRKRADGEAAVSKELALGLGLGLQLAAGLGLGLGCLPTSPYISLHLLISPYIALGEQGVPGGGGAQL